MHVHGDNLIQKENHTTKYLDADSRTYLTEIRVKYAEWENYIDYMTTPKIQQFHLGGTVRTGAKPFSAARQYALVSTCR
jgi:hypothetical protein